ncbi:MAG: hypothetical protein P4L83_21290 [Nevskia sp.]|nr:hypothetical protein [Nevskia sp.]
MAVTTTDATVYAVAEQPIVDASGNVTGTLPYGLIYATSGAPSGDHLYALSLDASRAVAPVQMSSATFSGSTGICSTQTLQTDARQASSQVLIYTTPGPDGKCSTADDVVQLVHYTDSATTPPSILALDEVAAANQLQSIANTDGTLGGIVALDARNNLLFYGDISFSAPKTLLTSVATTLLQDAESGFEFIAVTFTSGKTSLYRLDSHGTLSGDLYNFQGTASYISGVSNGGNLYFTEFSSLGISSGTGQPAGYSFNLIMTRLDGTTTAQVIANTSTTQVNGNATPDISVAGFIGSKAVVVFDAAANDAESAIYTYDTSVNGAALQMIFSAPESLFENSVAIVGNHIFACTAGTPGNALALVTTTTVLNVDGSVAKQFANTALIGQAYRLSGTAAPLVVQTTPSAFFLAEGIAQTNGTDAGATLEALSPDTLGTTPIVDGATGQPYVLANGQNNVYTFTYGMPVNAATIYVSSGTAAGSSQTDAAAFDAVNNVFYRLTNTPDTDETGIYY